MIILQQHVHFLKCGSTHEMIKSYLEDNEFDNILISTRVQTAGVGRGGKRWVHKDNALAFSLTISPCEPLSHLPLELGLYTSLYLQELGYGETKLKWPNDLFNNKGEKCGGIICQRTKGKIVAGIGINLGAVGTFTAPEEFDFHPGAVDPKLSLDDEDYKSIPADMWRYYHSKRERKKDIISEWSDRCMHMNREVCLWDQGEEKARGEFIGLNTDGAARISSADGVQEIYAGSLRIMSI